MDDQTNVYSEKKLASFETIYKESVFSKPLDITVTITAAHIYGAGYICVQTGTKEDDPEYGKYICGLEDITRISINTNNKSFPINVQCDEVEKGVPSRKRIILPHFPNAEEIMRLISDAKADYDRKHAPVKPKTDEEKQKERERLKKAADDEFLNATAGYEKPEKKSKKGEDFTVADILGLDDFTPIIPDEKKPEPVKEAVNEEPKAEIKEEAKEEAKKEEPIVEVSASETGDSILEAAPTVDISELEDIEEKASDVPLSDSFDEIVIPDTSDLPEAQAVENPGFIPSDIEEIGIVDIDEGVIAEPKIVSSHKTEAPKKQEEKPAQEEKKPEPKMENAAAKPEKKVDIETPKNGEKMSLEDFQTAVKKLKSMHDEGLLTDEEFSEEKSKLMKFLY
ncbi:MAG: SHOCT domain-containing protein [Oscillospiraceae bacterium]